MFGIGWTEMLVLGVVALIVIGPKDLPVVMNRLGKIVNSIRRMGSEFQRELNKATGIDQVTNLRNTITAPLKQTAAEIRNEFNRTTPTGKVEPSGIIKPADPAKESVVAEIHSGLGIEPPKPVATSPEPVKPAVVPASTAKVESPAPVEAIAPARKPRAPRKPKVAPATDGATAEAGAPKTPRPRKPRAPKAKPEA
jgi:sec-independent protein translocase protein TatB